MGYKIRNLLVVMDRETDRLVWATPYQEWPRLVPGLATLSSFQYFDPEGPSMVDINDLMVRRELGDGNKFIKVGLPIGAEFRKLILLKAKCDLTWRWLIGLHRLSLSVQGYIPNVPLGLPGTNDRALFEQELATVRENIAREINDNHWRIWAAETSSELEKIEQDLLVNRHSSQIYY